MDRDGTVFIHVLHRVPRTELHTEKKIKDGATIEVPVTTTVMVPEVKDEKVKLTDLQAFDTEGIPLPVVSGGGTRQPCLGYSGLGCP